MEPLTTENSVIIGKQTWTTKNLNITNFRNGDPIFEAKNEEEWRNASNKRQPACACFFFECDIRPGYESSFPQYGRFYNACAVNDPRGLAPKGWHIPSEAEYRELVNFSLFASKLKSPRDWPQGGGGNNKCGFTALPGGMLLDTGRFMYSGTDCFLWSNSSQSDGTQYALWLSFDSDDARESFYDPGWGHSVRCIKD